MKRNVDLGILIVRLSIGILFLLHGIHKIFNGIDMIEQQVADAGIPHFVSYGVYIGEVIAPLLIIFGLATRAGAVMMIIDCLTAIFLVSSDKIFQLNEQGGWALELLGLYLFGAVALIFTGGGKYAISRRYIWD